jgi:hypothetical protein
MFRLRRPKQVKEYEAAGEIERIYHEIQETLRVTGVNLNFRIWARYEKFFPVMWEAVCPNVETRFFENAADQLRAEAVYIAERWARPDITSRMPLGESQRYHIQAALMLYHYINPKLLLIRSSIKLALDGESIRQVSAGSPLELIARGAPAKMYPMEMVAEKPPDKRLRNLFDDIKQTLSLSSINSDYRTLALWPDYLAAAWAWLKLFIESEEYRLASNSLREMARALARSLPHAVPLSYERVQDLGENISEVVKTTEQFEALLPSLIINITLLGLDWYTPEEYARSPFPAEPRPPAQGIKE